MKRTANGVFTPVNMLQRIFKLLSQESRPITVEDMAQKLDSTPSTVRQNLADLTREGWARQSRGFYSITLEGRIRLEEDPYIKRQISSKKKTSIKLYELLPWDYIKTDKTCRSVLQAKKTYIHPVPQRELVPYVLMWLASMEQELPSFQDTVVLTEKDDEKLAMINIILDYLGKVADNETR